MLLLNPRRTRTNMKLLQLVWIFLLTLCGQSATTTMMVKEDDDIILDCSFGATNIENGAFDWVKFEDQEKTDVFLYADNKPQPGPQFGNRVSHFPDQLRFGNASIKITKAKTSDNGTYTCYHATVKKEVKSNISLTVGASPQPVVSLHRTNSGELLKCEVKGAFPKPVVEWWDSDGNVLPADKPQVEPQPGNKYDVILKITVTKSGDYRCVVTQDDIHHQVYTETYAHGPGEASKPSAKPIKNTDNGVLLQCEVFGASPELKIFWKDKAGNLVHSEEQKTETGGGYDIILLTTVTKTDYYRCVTTEGKKDDEIYDEIYVQGRDGVSNGLVIGLAVAVVVAFAVGVAVRHFCCKKQAGNSTTEQKNGSEDDPLHSAA